MLGIWPGIPSLAGVNKNMIQIILLVAAVAAPFLSYGFGRVQGKFETHAAVRAERTKQITECNTRVLTIQTEHEAAIRKAEDDARTAASTVSDTPTVPSELKKLCDASPTCRSRRAK